MTSPTSVMVLLLVTVTLLLEVTCVAGGGPVRQEVCGSKRSAVVGGGSAQVLVGGLLSLSEQGGDNYGCGGPSTGGMQEYEAIRWAVDTINQDSGTINGRRITDSYIPGVKLGVLMEDTCQRPEVAIDSLINILPELGTSEQRCASNVSTAMVGVLTNARGMVARQVSDVLGRYQIPSVHFASTSPALADTDDFPYVVRTVPSQTFQTQALLATLAAMGWTNVAVAYTDSEYGRHGLASLTEGAGNAGVCVSQAVRLPDGATSETIYRDAVRTLVAGPATAVVFLGDAASAALLMDMGSSVANSGRLQWVLPESVGTDLSIIQGRPYARGVLTMAAASRQIREFEDHWVRLSANSPPTDNPWYSEWYMTTNRCRLPGVTSTPYNSYPPCPQMSDSQRRTNFQQAQAVESAVVAVFAVARAVRDARADLCRGQSRGLCPSFLRMSSEDFYRKYLLPVDFTFGSDDRVSTLASTTTQPELSARRVRFTRGGEAADLSYAVYNYNNRQGSYRLQRVGTFRDGTLNLNKNLIRMYNPSRTLPLTSLPESRCPSTGCRSCLSGGAPSGRPVHVAGSVLLGGVFSVRLPGSPAFSCGPIDLQGGGAELIEAFLYGLTYARDQNLWPGRVNLGAIAWDDCGSADIANNALVNFLHGRTDPGGADPRTVVGYAAAGQDASTMAIASLLGRIPLPQLGYLPTPAALSDRVAFPLFTELLPGKETGLRAVVELLGRLRASHVRLLHDGSPAAVQLLSGLQQVGISGGLCVGGVALTQPGDYQGPLAALQARPEAKVLLLSAQSANHFDQLLAALNRSTDASEYLVIPDLTLAPGVASALLGDRKYNFRMLAWQLKVPVIDGWRRYLSSLNARSSSSSNPWLKQWYEAAFSCYLDPAVNPRGYRAPCQNVDQVAITAAPGFTSNPYSPYVVMAVGAMARALHRTLQQYCGSTYNSVCPRFYSAPDQAETMTRFLREDPYLNGALVNGYDILYRAPGANTFTMIGDVQYTMLPSGERRPSMTLGAGALQRVGSVRASCSGAPVCPDCVYMYEAAPSLHLDGDLLLAGLFNVHRPGTSPFTCDGLRAVDGFQYTEAFLYAIQRVNDKSAPVALNGVRLGGLGLDDCSSPLRASNLASSVYAGAVMPRDSNGRLVDISDIKGWLMYTSGISQEVASILGQLGVSAISPSASSITLSNRNQYPTFYRTVPSDDKQAMAMARFVDYMGWRYVQTVNTPNVYGRTGIEAFRKALTKTTTCATSSYELDTDGDANDVVQKLLASSTDIVVVFANEQVIRELLAAKARVGREASGLVFVASERVPDMIEAASTLAFAVDIPTLQEFNTYLDGRMPQDGAVNPWFNEAYQELYQCNLPGNSRYERNCVDVTSRPITRAPSYQQDARVLTTVNAVYALVEAIHLALRERCGINYNGVCQAFRSSPDSVQLIVNKLQDVTFTDPSGVNLRFSDRQHDRGYGLYRYGANGEALLIGSYRDGTLMVTDVGLPASYSNARSDCPGVCTQCQFLTQENEQFTSIPGSVLLAGLFDVHASGNGPFTCGPIQRDQGWQLVEAFNFALGRVNNKTGVFHGRLPGVTLGGVALDTCSSPTRAATLVANVQSGLLPLTSGNTRINPDNIEVYVGAYDSDTSAAVASVLNVLGIPQLSYGATSTAFKDSNRYPNFLRTVPADDKLARAIVALLRNYRIEYVQVVHSPGTYGDDAARQFTRLAAENAICVAQAIRLAVGGGDGRLSNGQAERAARRLLDKPLATVVVTFIATEDINAFLKAVERVTQDIQFHFVGSETWSNRLDLLEGVNRVAADALTLGVETADLSTFDRYLGNPAGQRANPWFEEYYEEVYGCSLTPGSSRFRTACELPMRDIVRAPGYTQDAYVLYTTNAVYSAALGLDYALRQTCGDSYNGVCQNFRNAANRRQLMLEGIRRATFRDATNQQFQFTSDGESNRGYHIYTARRPLGSANFYYENVGSYNDSHLLKIRPRQEFEITWSSDCSSPGACQECATLGHRPTRAMARTRPNLNLVGFFDVHGPDPREPLRCGPLNSDSGFQNVLAFFYALNLFNRTINNIDVGGLAIDTCGSDVRVSRDTFSLLMGQSLCEADGVSATVDPSSIVAFIPHASASSSVLVPLLSPRRVTIVSPTSSDDRLTGQPYFLSTIPPDSKQAEVLAEVTRRLDWYYISAINSDTEEANSAMAAFFNSSGEKNVCIGQRLTLPAEGATAAQAQELLRNLSQQQGARAVVLFTNEEQTRLLLEAARDLNLEDNFIFLSSTAGVSDSTTRGVESAANGAISLKLREDQVQGFIDYVTSLTVANHGDIPDDWFVEFWQLSLQCKLENSSLADDQYARVCASSDRLSPAMVRQDESVLQTIIATYVSALGLLNAGNCQDSPIGIAGCLREKGDQRRQLIYEGIQGTSWNVFPDRIDDPLNFRFTKEGYGDTGFKVMAFVREDGSNRYVQREIGTWTAANGLRLNVADYVSRVAGPAGSGSNGRPRQPPSSSCPTGPRCRCLDFSGKSKGFGGTGGLVPSLAPVVGDDMGVNATFQRTWAIVVAALAALGILVTLCTFVYLLIFYPTKGGTSVLGFLLLLAVLAMYTLVFAFILNSVPETCAIRRFCLGLVYALAFSCMLVKVLNTWQLGAYFSEYLPTYERLAHPCSLVAIVLGLTLVQVIIGVEWLILKPPLVELYPYQGRNIPRCVPADFHNEELVLSCIYVMVLMLLTLIFAAVTWDSKENHRESRWLLITTCFSIGILIVWTIISTLAEIQYREPAIAIALLVNATILLLAIFVRKIYLLNKYQKEAEEERKSQFAVHDDTKDPEFYSTMYNNQAFDHTGDSGSRKGPGSHTGSGVVYVYEGAVGM